VDIATFDTADADQADAVLRACADVDAWVEALVAGRPYGSVEALVARADVLAAGWTGEQVEAALADHPRIGERHVGSGRSAAMSGREQAGVDTSAGVATRLAAGNAAYEERFGRIFLVRAAGRSADDVLALLEERLGHDPETELAVTAGQLREIALLRLEDTFS
jgi:2-oxo-4-hydroxy-4-carboxy-5-ureidoimidazoline decarboxylase